jgi:alkylhydroperoxidase family enzyme
MNRIAPVNRPEDHPGASQAEIADGLANLFAALFPGKTDPAFDDNQLAQTSGLIAGKLAWSQRTDLRELAILTLCRRLGADYAYGSRLPSARAAGLDEEQIAALADWRTSDRLDEEQKLTIEYADAVAGNVVSDDLSARVVARWGEAGAVECTALVAFWSCWALFLNSLGAKTE